MREAAPADGAAAATARSAGTRSRPAGLVDPVFWRDRKVLLTGHTGFKGAWLSLWLTRMEATVTGFAHATPTTPSLYELARVGELVTDIKADVRDVEALDNALAETRPDTVIHMAAQPLVRPSFADPRSTYEINVIGTVNVLDAVRRRGDGTKAVLIVTSDKCYDNQERDYAYREEDPMGGHDPYSSSKGCAELVTDAFRRSFFSARHGPAIASARAGNVIGGGDWAADRLVPDIMRGALAGETIRIRNPNSLRPWQHVLNPLSGYQVLVQALHESHEHATAFNFGPADEDAQPVSWITQRIQERWGEPLRFDQDPGPHPHEATYLKLDSSRAKARLNWSPAWDLATGLDATVEWYRALERGEDIRAISHGQIELFQRAATSP